MHLKQIHIENFQNHKISDLTLDGGVNVISGDSDSGKTAILRAVNLVLNNKPAGYGFKPWSVKKKDITTATLAFPEGSVTRRKSDSIDEYILNIEGEESQTFSTLNRQVPEEVQKFLNLKPYNFQSQHDQHFFISETPAERARMLNEITGLSIIDSSLSNINSIIRENSAQQKQIDESITSTTKKLQEIQFVDEADKILVHLEGLFTQSEQLEKMNKELQSYVEEITSVEKEISMLEKFLLVREIYGKIREQLKQYLDLVKQNEELTEYAYEMESVESTISVCSDFIDCKDGVTKLKKMILQYEQISAENSALVQYAAEINEIEEIISSTEGWLKCKIPFKKLSDMISQYGILECENRELQEWADAFVKSEMLVVTLGNDISALKEKKKMYLKELGQCPLCGSQL